jgi:hypothetical protein
MNRPCALAPVVLAVVSLACRGIEPELRSLMQATDAQVGLQIKHVGPPVEVAGTGPARYVRALHEAFRPHRAMELVTFIDRFYRAPANQGYDEVLARLDKALREIGFDGQDSRLQVEFIKVSDVERAWTPVSGKVVLQVDGEEPRTLHSFSKSEDVDRVMLPVNAPSCNLRAEVALALDDIKKGMVLVTDVKAEQVMMRARNRGAVAIVSASLQPFNEDSTGAGRHLEAIQFTTLARGFDLPVLQISPRSKEAIEAAVDRAQRRGAKVRLELEAKVVTENRPLRTLMATIRGAKKPKEAVAMVSHVQEPGACDNATGVAGLLEGARSLVEALREGKLPWPERTLVLLWGDEFRQSECWLDSTDMKPIVGISSDMTGQSKETGANALLERNYDPGALRVLGPDFHTPWGAGQVSAEDIFPNGLAVIARCAMADVSLLEGGSWSTAEHPFEGGSDHDKFIDRGIPAVLFWHFTDFTYHTSLDRLQFVDPEEMRRTGVALLATALAVASAGPEDLDRYLRTLDREQSVRVNAAKDASDSGLAEAWEEWCFGTREWLRNLCLGIDEKLPQPRK